MKLALLLAGPLLTACLDMQNTCTPDSALTTTLRIAPSSTVGSALVTGALARPSNVTVDQLVVAGVGAATVAGDFDRFSATVPLVSLLATRDTMIGTISPMIVAQTNCRGAVITVTNDATKDLSVTLAPSITPPTLTVTDGSSVPIFVQFYGYPVTATTTASRTCSALGAIHLDIQTIPGGSLKATVAHPDVNGSLLLTLLTTGATKGDAIALVCQDENANQTVLTVTVPG
jgi:hypothetical protein